MTGSVLASEKQLFWKKTTQWTRKKKEVKKNKLAAAKGIVSMKAAVVGGLTLNPAASSRLAHS